MKGEKMGTREQYIKYFTHMENEDKKVPLGGMGWDDVCWWLHEAIDEDKLFTANELADMFPSLLCHIRE